jgi:hypothetical protein
MALDVRLEPIAAEELPALEYRWDADTDILCAMLRGGAVAEGVSGSLDLEGADGSWLTFELTDGRLAAIEVAVWPDVASVETLQPPAEAGAARVQIPTDSEDLLAAMEVDTAIRAVADAPERTIHFRIGPSRPSRAVRVARDLLLEVDGKHRIAGLWFLNVPPFPAQ